MALPKLSQPIFELKIPSTGKAIHYRPFTVREEKLLLMAQESGERKDIVNVYKQIINNCSIDQIDVDALASFDIEYIFICLRSKSVSNISKVQIKDDEDGETYEVEINLDKVEIVKSAEVSSNVKLTDSVGVILKYPTFKTMAKLDPEADKMETTFEVLRGCIHQVYEGDEVYDTANYSKQELTEFIESLNKSQIEEIQKFFETMPKLKVVGKYLTKDNKLKEVPIEGIENFF
jgi:hypothetical protein